MLHDFDFLIKDYPNIYENVKSAIENSVIDSDISTFKIRKSLEELLKIIFQKEGLQISNTLYNNIRLLHDKGILDDYAFSVCEYIRNVGNAGIHNNSVNNIAANNIIDAFYIIAKWHVKKYNKSVNPKEIFERNSLHNIANRYKKNTITEEEQEIFSSVMKSLENLIEELIINDRMDGFGVLGEIEYLSLDEYYTYFLKALRILADYSKPELRIMSNVSLELIVRFKQIAKVAYSIGDDYKINRILSDELYKHTPWWHRR